MFGSSSGGGGPSSSSGKKESTNTEYGAIIFGGHEEAPRRREGEWDITHEKEGDDVNDDEELFASGRRRRENDWVKKKTVFLGLCFVAAAVFGCAAAANHYSSVSASSSFIINNNNSDESLGASSFVPKLGMSSWRRWNGETVGGTPGINILFVKTIKTGSTTIAGLCRRIANRHGLNGARTGYNQNGSTEIDDKQEPYVYADHRMFKQTEGTLSKLDHPTFLLTSIRDPVSRFISEFQYVMDTKESHDKDYRVPDELLPMPVTNEEWESRLLTFLNMQTSIDHQYDYIGSQKACDNKWSPAGVVNLYDHVVVLERFDESMIVLKNMLGLSNSDLLYLRAKENDYTWGGGGLSAATLAKVKNALSASRDYALIDQANQRLNGHISQIPDFSEQMSAYKNLLAGATAQCSQYAPTGITVGDFNQCLYEDQACGDECLTAYGS